jgi:hypothetical protein
MMSDFEIFFLESAEQELIDLRDDPSKKSIFKAVYKSLKFMRINLKHPSLNTHK